MTTGILTGIAGLAAQALSPGANSPGQSFQNHPVPNTRSALYALAIVGPQPSTAIYASYTFPLSPSSLFRDYTAMSNIYDVAGTQAQAGVQRKVDAYGNSPVTFTIEGTTGWQLHATDGYSYTGIDSILALQQFLLLYAQLNTGQAINNQPLYVLEFYDYFLDDYWQVEPIGKQDPIRQSAARPLLAEYSFRLAGIVDLGQAPALPVGADPINTLLSTSAGQLLGNLSSSLNAILTAYAPSTPGASALGL